MIHTPCLHNIAAVCRVNGKCKRAFPKSYCDYTRVIENRYPEYQRRRGGFTKNDIDNQYVVPYNSVLLKMFNAHINVEICTSLNAVKYLFKYIYKGYDCAQVTVTKGE